MYVCCMFHIIICISVLTCRLVRIHVSIDIQEATLPLLLYGASSIYLPATWYCLSIGTDRHYSASTIFIGIQAYWPVHKCRDIAYDNNQICGPAIALPQILTPTLHRHVETPWSPLHKPLSQQLWNEESCRSMRFASCNLYICMYTYTCIYIASEC
jgi:hypothetical protein